MLTGRGEVELMASGCARMERLDTDAVTLPEASLLQVICEIESSDVEELLPPSLHPTLPGLLSWQILECPKGPWGAFRLALTRLECRSGVRPRAFVVSGRIDNEQAQAGLAAGWGYSLQLGEIDFRRSYDSVYAAVFEDDICVLELGLKNPQPLGPSDVQYVSDCHLAHTPRGIRLVQVDPTITVTRAERGTPEVGLFEAADWGDERIVPNYPVSASIVTADITFEKLRFLGLPDQTAFTGTEKI